ncbi:MAG: ankyrin repeat domain-containing protein [Bacteroidetes bacterium]|nr:ankyrin repeat domain-containing protein [Bacteroidota bacterium]
MKYRAFYILLILVIASSTCNYRNRHFKEISVNDRYPVLISEVSNQQEKPNNPPPVTLLFAAIKTNDTSEIKKLILSGCDVNEKIIIGCNTEDAPLRHAVYYCDTSNLRFLLEHGANPNLIINGNMTPTHYAAGLGNDKFKLLIKYGGDVNTYGGANSFSTPFIWALSNDRTENIITMLNEAYVIEPDSVNGFDPALVSAIRYEDFEVIDILIEYGADINVVVSNPDVEWYCANPDKMTPLHVLADVYSRSKNKEQIEHIILKFVQLGANINAENAIGQTPLDFAKCNNDTSMIRILIQNGAK